MVWLSFFLDLFSGIYDCLCEMKFNRLFVLNLIRLFVVHSIVVNLLVYSLYINIYATYRLGVSIILPENEFVFFLHAKQFTNFFLLTFCILNILILAISMKYFALHFVGNIFIEWCDLLSVGYLNCVPFCVLLLTIQFCGC